MTDRLPDDLLFAAIVIGVLSLMLAARDLPFWLAAIVAAVRVGLPLVYFGSYEYLVGWTTVLDDQVYMANSHELLMRGYDPITLLFTPDGWELMASLSGGQHVMYAWWNVLAMTLFGEHYYSAVFLNVLLTFVSGWLLVRMLKSLGFAGGYCGGFLLFWLLHWDVLAWSSLLNIKDVLVQSLTIAGLYSLVRYFTTRNLRYVAMFAVVATLFWWIRFYVPFVMIAAAMIWMLTQWNDWRRFLLVPACAAAGFVALRHLPNVRDYFDLGGILYGAVRYALTPTPWSIHEDYYYLTIPSVMHWLLAVPAVIGGMVLWRESRVARLCLIYLAFLVALYAATDDLLGPRQRFQATFIIAWAQFHSLWIVKQAWDGTLAARRSASPWMLPESAVPVHAIATRSAVSSARIS